MLDLICRIAASDGLFTFFKFDWYIHGHIGRSNSDNYLDLSTSSLISSRKEGKRVHKVPMLGTLHRPQNLDVDR